LRALRGRLAMPSAAGPAARCCDSGGSRASENQSGTITQRVGILQKNPGALSTFATLAAPDRVGGAACTGRTTGDSLAATRPRTAQPAWFDAGRRCGQCRSAGSRATLGRMVQRRRGLSPESTLTVGPPVGSLTPRCRAARTQRRRATCMRQRDVQAAAGATDPWRSARRAGGFATIGVPLAARCHPKWLFARAGRVQVMPPGTSRTPGTCLRNLAD